MDSERDPSSEPEPADPEEDNDPGLAGGGGPASVIYGDDETADEAGEEMLKAPDERG